MNSALQVLEGLPATREHAEWILHDELIHHYHLSLFHIFFLGQCVSIACTQKVIFCVCWENECVSFGNNPALSADVQTRTGNGSISSFSGTKRVAPIMASLHHILELLPLNQWKTRTNEFAAHNVHCVTRIRNIWKWKPLPWKSCKSYSNKRELKVRISHPSNIKWI